MEKFKHELQSIKANNARSADINDFMTLDAASSTVEYRG